MIWLIFLENALLISDQQHLPANPSEFGLLIEESHDIGEWRGVRCLTAEVQQPLPSLPTGWAFQPLRSLMPVLQAEMFQWAGKAFQILQWAKITVFVDVAVEKPILKRVNTQKFAQNVVSFTILDFLPL
jgi:NADH pyrophosphatase NudC (nudix superfamily)